MDDEILQIVRDQNRDQRELSKEISDLALIVARHDEMLKDRADIIVSHRTRLDSLEAISWKPIVAIVTIVMGVMVIALFLAAGGDPEKVPELLQ